MIIFGLRASNIGTFATERINCDYCNTKGSQRFSVYGKYFHIFWIPIFPISKKVFSECIHCKRTITKKEFSTELKETFLTNKGQIKRPFWHWSGLILIGLLALSIAFIGKTSKGAATSKNPIVEYKTLDADKIKEAVIRSNSKSPIIIIAKSIMEVNNVNQIISLKDKIALYEQNPKSVDDYTKDTKWLLMIDNLMDSDYLWIFDNSDGDSSIILGLETLAKKKKYILPILPAINDDNLSVAEVLAIFNKSLNKHGLTLIELFLDNDSHVTGLITKENFTQLKQNARSAGYMIFEY